MEILQLSLTTGGSSQLFSAYFFTKHFKYHIPQISDKFENPYLVSVSELNKPCMPLVTCFRLNLENIHRRIIKVFPIITFVLTMTLSLILNKTSLSN